MPPAPLARAAPKSTPVDEYHKKHLEEEKILPSSGLVHKDLKDITTGLDAADSFARFWGM